MMLARLQHLFLTFSSDVFLQKCQTDGLEVKQKFRENKTSISCLTRGNLTIHFLQGSVGVLECALIHFIYLLNYITEV